MFTGTYDCAYKTVKNEVRACVCVFVKRVGRLWCGGMVEGGRVGEGGRGQCEGGRGQCEGGRRRGKWEGKGR